MPYSIDTSATFTRVIYSGTLDNEDIQGVLKDSLRGYDEEINPTNRLEDIRKVEGIRLGFNDLMKFSETLRTIKLTHTSKTVILTGNPLQYGIARMFQTILTHPQMNLKVYSDEEEAITWLTEK